MVYKGSRYASGELYYDEELQTPYIAPQDTVIESKDTDYLYQYKQWDRLDLLAERFYGNPQAKWVILYANPQYTTEYDIKAGDTIIIPNLEER